LRVALQHIEEQLDDRVDALNNAGPSSEESTADLIHLEETLSSAQDKAKKLVTLRLKLDEEEANPPAQSHEREDGGERGNASNDAAAAADEPPPSPELPA
jgi:hypothetical protein